MDKHPVLFVSLGPGEAEFITLKGFRALGQADYIICPATVTGNGSVTSRAADILHQLDIPADKIILFSLPMSKDRSQALSVYNEMFVQASAHYQQSHRVVVVAEGDAGFYSSIHYVYDRLREADIPAGFVPGIPAFIACGARAGLHIAQQEERLVVIPGNTTAGELQTFLQSGTTVAIMKVSQCADELHQFITAYPDYKYYYFENVGTDKEYYSTDTSELQGKQFPYFSLMIIKKE